MTLWPLCCELENSWFRFLMSRTGYKTLSFEEFDYTLFCVFLNLLFTYMSALVFGTYLLGIHNIMTTSGFWLNKRALLLLTFLLSPAK